jgi:hypothetical protein
MKPAGTTMKLETANATDFYQQSFQHSEFAKQTAFSDKNMLGGFNYSDASRNNYCSAKNSRPPARSTDATSAG